MSTFAFTVVDFIVIGIIVFSGILGLVRGLAREACSLVGFILAMYLAYTFSAIAATQWLSLVPGGVIAQNVLAFAVIFVLVLILAKIITNTFSRLINSIGLSFFDRLLGAVFGFARGALIVVVLSTLFALTDIPKSSEYKDALTKPAVETAVGFIRNWLPDDWASQLLKATDIRQVP